jgi:transposase
MSASNVVTVPAERSREVEVVAKPTRRRFTVDYKMKVLKEADACHKPGEIGTLLRREGLYFSNLKVWREQRRKGELAGLAQKKRGPAPKATNPLAARVAALEKETARLNARAARAEALVELQKKVSTMLRIELQRNGERD